MKRKIKFNNQNFKHKFKIAVLAFIVVASVYLLYFNDKILVQSIVQKSLQDEVIDTNKSNITENFDVFKYVDICKNRKTRFYGFRMGSSISTLGQPWRIDGSNNCENLCDTTANCQFFTMKENEDGVVDDKKCYLYIKALDISNIDRSNMKIDVNCNSSIVPLSNSTSSYNGFGYINKKYFEYNKDKFQYKDANLDKANELIATLKANRSNLNAIATSNGENHTQLTANALNHTTTMGNWISSFGQLIGISSENLTTLSNTTDIFNQSIFDDEKNNALKKLAAISKETPELDNKIVDVKSSGYVNNLFYTILAFIMVITIILLLIYKLNDNIIITDRFMIFYFIIIVIIFMFIRFMLK